MNSRLLLGIGVADCVGRTDEMAGSVGVAFALTDCVVITTELAGFAISTTELILRSLAG